MIKNFYCTSFIAISLIQLGHGMDPKRMTEEERAANLLAWSEPLRLIQSELNNNLGLEPETIRVLSFEKIVMNIWPKQSGFLLGLAQTASQEEWDQWCRKFVIESGNFVVDKKDEKESAESYEMHKSIYLDYVYHKFQDGYQSPLCRQITIIFFCAFEYFKKSRPNAAIKLVYSLWSGGEPGDEEDSTFWGDITENGCELCLRTVNGKCLEDCPMDIYTLPYFIRQQQEEYSGLVEVIKDESFLGFYFFWHELGHLWHELLTKSKIECR